VFLFGACDHFKKEIEVDPEAKPIYRDPMVQPQAKAPAKANDYAKGQAPAKADPQPLTPEAPRDWLHTVRYSGETLAIIALWYTGSTDHWPRLAAANPRIDPKRIYIGHRIRIPAKLVKIRKPLPRSFVARHVAPQASSVSKPEAPPSATPQPSAASVPATTTAGEEATSEVSNAKQGQAPSAQMATSDNTTAAPSPEANDPEPNEAKPLPALFGPRDITETKEDASQE
jgi:hypothetical protein